MKRYIFILTVLFAIVHPALGQFNKYLFGFDINPYANGKGSVFNLTMVSTQNKLPLKLSSWVGGPSSPFAYYHYTYAYIKPGLLIKLEENIEKKRLVYLSVNLNAAYLWHTLKIEIEDDFRTKRVVEFNAESAAFGYELEFGKYSNLGNTMFSLHYGIAIGNIYKSKDVMNNYIKLDEPINNHAPGLGYGKSITGNVFLGIATRL
jgi:hypothetical protein